MLQKFKDLKVGQWFDFTDQRQFAGVFGPFKKTGNRTYLYHSRCWHETQIGSVNVDVVVAERPDNAPNELVDIHINWNKDINGYLVKALTYKTRDVEEPSETDHELDPEVFYADDTSQHKALLKAIREAKRYGGSLVSDPIDTEMVCIFLNGEEHLVIKPNNGKAKITAGVGNPRHPINRKRA